MKKWYPYLALRALLFVFCSMSIHGTLSFANSAAKLTETASILHTNIAENLTENSTNYAYMMTDTQVINMPLDSARKDIIRDCDAINAFQNKYEHLYPDTVAHRDTLTICPPNETKRIFVTFTAFEVAPGDTLYVYEADSVQANRRIAAYSGAGVSATGGWVQSECNPTGCLTFEFATNGDNAKGRGWESWVSCQDLEATNIVCPAISSAALACGEAYAIVPIQAPDSLNICGDPIDTFCLTIYNAQGMACLDTCVKFDAIVRDTFGVGLFKAVWRAKNFPTRKVEKTFTVSAPTLICNDEVFIPLGSACALYLTPDMLLESPCDTITDTLYYRIDIEIGNGNLKKTITGGGGPGLPYPIIYRDTLLKYGVADLCGGNLTARISRVFYEYMLDDMTICTNGMSETSCETVVNFDDQSPPFFVNFQNLDTVVACDTLGLMGFLKAPEVVANCDTAIVSLDGIQLVDNVNTCNTGKVAIRWKAVDLCGNTSYLSDTLFIIRPTQFYHPGRTILNCNSGYSYEDAEKPGLLTGTIENGVFTPRDTVHLSTEAYICGYILVKKDQQFPSDCGERWTRSWKVLDWCNSSIGPVQIATQAITITDTIAPTFVDCPDSSAVSGANNPLLIDLGHFECEINMTAEKLVAPTATDNCDPNPSVKMFCVEQLHEGIWKKLGTNLSNSGALFCDTFRIGWVADDACHEQLKQDTCFKYVIIRDVTKPSAVCVDELNFFVGSNWSRIINVDEIDGGSWDACGIAKREISFDGITWDTMATLACEAIHDNPKIYLRITDTKGNYNICHTKLNVRDDIYPSCGKLPDVDLFCDEFKAGDLGGSTDTNKNGLFDEDEYLPLTGDMLTEFNTTYGNPLDICDDNIRCHPMTIEQEYQLVERSCGQTQIQRRYRAIDWASNQSPWETQLIALEYRPNWKITLPADWSGDCGEAFPVAAIDIQSGSCDQIGWEHEDKVFIVKDEACYKVERTYHIINWCLYKAGDDPYLLNRVEDDYGFVDTTRTINYTQYPTNGYLTYIQVLKVHSFDGPTITINDIDTCLTREGTAGETATTVDGMYNCDEMRTFSAEATSCVDFAALDFWWTIYIDEIKVDSGKGSKFNYPVNPGLTYRVQFSANDPCGNGTTIHKDYTFTDCKKPTAYCESGIRVEMGQEGKITVWPSDVNLGSFDNCTPKNLLRYALWHSSIGEPPATLNEVLSLSGNIDFDCNNYGTQIIRMYVIDKGGNYAFCTSTIDVQDNMGVCQSVDPESFVSGSIQTTDDKMMNNVTVTATTSDGNSIATVTENGLFQISLPKNDSYTLKPELDTNPLNGVTTFDLVLISKHILGLQSFNSPYQYVAADVNQSGTISAYDMVQLRQLILNINQKFPNNTSWKFVDANYAFTTDSPAEESYRETVELLDMEAAMQVDFMAVKIGDVNQSASFDEAVSAESRSFTAIQVADQTLEAGQTYTVDFVLPATTKLDGYQFTIDFQDLVLIDMVEATAMKHNFGFNLTERGLLTTSWNTSGAVATEKVTNLFSLIFKSSSTGRLSEKLKITSSITTAEAYDADGNITNVQLDFINSEPTSLQLYQNRPNPFRDKTSIGFYLPEAGKADLRILDVQGKVLKEISGIYESGDQEIQLNAADLTDKGVLYYQLIMDKKQVIKRMIVIE
ncbi:MAG: T9SS type A sorting domain-containing protein [Saprospiraceae bacterium]